MCPLEDILTALPAWRRGPLLQWKYFKYSWRWIQNGASSGTFDSINLDVVVLPMMYGLGGILTANFF